MIPMKTTPNTNTKLVKLWISGKYTSSSALSLIRTKPHLTSCLFFFCRNSNGEWVTGTVLENLDEMIKLKLPGDQTHWAHYDVDRTAPHLAM